MYFKVFYLTRINNMINYGALLDLDSKESVASYKGGGR